MTAKNGKRSRIDGEKRKSIRNGCCDSKQGQDHHSLFVPSFLSELEKLCFGGTAFGWKYPGSLIFFPIFFSQQSMRKVKSVWYMCLKIENYYLKISIEIRAGEKICANTWMLFKNWKWLFENINQTPPNYLPTFFSHIFHPNQANQENIENGRKKRVV